LKGKFFNLKLFQQNPIYLSENKQHQKDCKWQIRLSKRTCQNEVLPFKCRKMTNEQLRITILYLELRKMSLQEKNLKLFLHVALLQVKVLQIYREEKMPSARYSASRFTCRPAM